MIRKVKWRNPVARSPLLRKGGVHATPKQRKIDSGRLFQDAVLEWESEQQYGLFYASRRNAAEV